jgi:WASH complex subunit strumpellin
LKIWQEEVTRIINFNVEQECNPFLKRRVHDWASTYQSEAIPIPKFAPVDTSVNFIGRLGRELLLHSSPSNTIFLDKLSAWYSPQGREMISLKTFALLLKSTSVSGLVGLDKLFAFMIVTDMKVLINQTVTILKQGGLGQMIAGLAKKMHPPNLTPAGIFKLYQVALKDAQKAYGHLAEILGRIGQKQLLRKQIANILSVRS